LRKHLDPPAKVGQAAPKFFDTLRALPNISHWISEASEILLALAFQSQIRPSHTNGLSVQSARLLTTFLSKPAACQKEY